MYGIKRESYEMKEKELNWISTHFEELENYWGKWVAIVEDKIVASGDSVKEVMEIVKQKKIKEKPLVTLVPARDEETYVL